MTREARRLMDLLGVRIDVTRPMRGLSIADQQMVEIARALASDSRLIIMDEPTAPLTPKEVETLFGIARRLRDEGRTIVFISHRLEEVRALCDRVTIFRDGNKVATDDHRQAQRRRHHPPDDRPAAQGVHAQARARRSARWRSRSRA